MVTEASASRYEPDILAVGLDIIFCGLNPAASAVAGGHNFSHPNNRFWSVLHLAGFTDTRLRPEDERHLLDYGCGVTTVVRRPTRRAGDISSDEFRTARPGLEAKIRRYAPRAVAFLGKRALATMLGRAEVEWGAYGPGFAETRIWVLPNPSGLNKTFTLEALVRAYAEPRAASTQGSWPRGATMGRQHVGHRSINVNRVTSSRSTRP
jgi:double-stranded uracil-DNA glycosylase